jgi:RNA methyltransferase, TrmH family
VREALRAGAVVDVFATAEAMDRHPDLTSDADEISAKDAAALSETVTPQGLVAVCRTPILAAADLLASRPRLLAVLVEPNDPGNLGTIIRTADAAGADGVIVDGGADPYNGKAVRASAGSLFHVPVVAYAAEALVAMTDELAMRVLATSGTGRRDLDDLIDSGDLSAPTVWLFGSEAHGLPSSLLGAADETVRIPLYGRAESLNVAAAAAVALYASARAQRGSIRN